MNKKVLLALGMSAPGSQGEESKEGATGSGREQLERTNGDQESMGIQLQGRKELYQVLQMWQIPGNSELVTDILLQRESNLRSSHGPALISCSSVPTLSSFHGPRHTGCPPVLSPSLALFLSGPSPLLFLLNEWNPLHPGMICHLTSWRVSAPQGASI